MPQKDENSCDTHPAADQQYEPVEPRVATGNAPVLVEIICERVHCVLYDYAINTVDMIIEAFGDLVEIQTIVRQGDKRTSQRYMDLCKKAGRMLPVPTILINGEAVFTSVPHPNELEDAIRNVLISKGFLQDNKPSNTQSE